MMNHPHPHHPHHFIIESLEFDGQGGTIKVAPEEVAGKIRDGMAGWVHLDARRDETRDWLHENIFYLDPIIVDALLAEETRPRVSEYPDGFLIILRGINFNENEDEEDMISIRMWIDSNRIISTRRRKLRAVSEIRDRLHAGHGPGTSADFLVQVLSGLTDNMEPVVMKLDDQTDDMEEQIIENPAPPIRKTINEIRRKCIILRRYISPQKEAINHLRMSDVPWLDSRHRLLIQENLDRVTRYVEDLDSIRERGQIIKDELASIMSDRMNKNLYVLSLIAALFLPLGFLTGLLGINVGGMPGADNPAAFAFVCVICGIVLVLEYCIFRLLRWI